MNEMKKRKFQVLDNNEESQEGKRNLWKIMIPVAILLVIAVVGVLIYLKFKTYKTYEVVEEIKTEGISESEFYDYKGELLKVSKNGAIYTTVDGKLIWNQSYEMNSPIIDICKEYVVIGSKKGSEIYIFSEKGTEGMIETSGQIRAVEVANQGTVAVMTERNSSYYINLYDTKGEKLVQGEMHLENSGYPLSMSLSSDAQKLAIALVNVTNGQADTTLNFYNFGRVGQNEIDNLVNSYTYEGEIIPRIHYLDDSRVVAFSTSKLHFFKGTQKPEEVETVKNAGEVRGVFYSDKYVGCTYNVKVKDEKTKKTTSMHELVVYDGKGKEVMKQQYKKDFDRIEILNNDEIVLSLENACRIYSISGTVKFEGSFADSPLKIEQAGKGNEYYVLYKDKTQKIKLK